MNRYEVESLRLKNQESDFFLDRPQLSSFTQLDKQQQKELLNSPPMKIGTDQAFRDR